MKRTAAICGVGYTPFTKDSGASVLHLAAEACDAAVADAGLDPASVDGVATFSLNSDSTPAVAVASSLGASEAKVLLDVQMGGQAPCYLTGLMARLIESGEIETAVVYRAMNGRSESRVGGMSFPGEGALYRYPIGYGGYASYVAMWATRFLHETGQGTNDLWAVVERQSAAAQTNPRAIRPHRVTEDEYRDSPFVVEPFRKWDCTAEVDGACAIVMTTLERARDLRWQPVEVKASAYSAHGQSGTDIGDHLAWSDYTRNYTSWLQDRLFGQAGLTPQDIDIAEIYDCFSSTVLVGLEGLGFCGRGESGAFLREGGPLAVNTHGGLLYEGYLHGMNTVTEAVLQLQGRAGANQCAAHSTAAVTSGALMDGSALILTSE